MRYQENPEVLRSYQNKRPIKGKKNVARFRISFNIELKQGPYYICTICHPNLYQSVVRLFKYEKCHILSAELYHSVKSFDEQLYMCKTFYKHLHKDEIPCQVVCNKMTLDPITTR